MSSSLSQTQIESLSQQVISELSQDELLFFLNWADDELVYVYFSNNDNLQIQPIKLRKLRDIGVVDECPTCVEDVWYTLSQIGIAVRSFMSKSKG